MRTCCQPARQIPDLPQHIPGIPTCVSPPLDESDDNHRIAAVKL